MKMEILVDIWGNFGNFLFQVITVQCTLWGTFGDTLKTLCAHWYTLDTFWGHFALWGHSGSL